MQFASSKIGFESIYHEKVYKYVYLWRLEREHTRAIAVLEAVAEFADVLVTVAIGDRAVAVLATVALGTRAIVATAPLDAGTEADRPEEAVAHALVVQPLAHESVAVAECEHAAAVPSAVGEVALVHLAVVVGELAEAVRVVVLEGALVQVAVLEEHLAVAGHAVALPLAGVLEHVAASHQRHGLFEHVVLERVERVAHLLHKVVVALLGREHARAVAVLEAIDELALERVAVGVVHHAVAVLDAVDCAVAYK